MHRQKVNTRSHERSRLARVFSGVDSKPSVPDPDVRIDHAFPDPPRPRHQELSMNLARLIF